MISKKDVFGFVYLYCTAYVWMTPFTFKQFSILFATAVIIPTTKSVITVDNRSEVSFCYIT